MYGSVVCSSFINTNCSHEAGLLVQCNTLINNTMCITKRYKIFKPISINNNLVLKLVPCDSLLTNNPSHMGNSGLPDLTLFMKLTHDSALRTTNGARPDWHGASWYGASWYDTPGKIIALIGVEHAKSAVSGWAYAKTRLSGLARSKVQGSREGN